MFVGWLICLSWSKLSIIQIVLETEFTSDGLLRDRIHGFSIRISIVCFIVGPITYDWDEVRIDGRLERAHLRLRIWVEMTVLEVNVISVVIQVVTVILSIRAKVIHSISIIVLVGVALWILQVICNMLWSLVCRRRDVLNLLVDKSWVVNSVGVWLWVWVVNFWNIVHKFFWLLSVPVVLLCFVEFEFVQLWALSLPIVLGVVWEDSVLVWGSIVLEGAVVRVSVLHVNLIVEVTEDVTEIEVLLLMRSAVFEVANFLVEMFQFPVGTCCTVIDGS